ncbi:MAG: GIY-YIG nuclease family protein [Fulvivirga sp.]
MAYCYILYSHSLNRFYIGSTQDMPESRLTRHLLKGYGTHSFSAKANDWEIFHAIVCNDIKQAREIERHVKKMKGSTYIKNLKKYPEMTQKLLKRFGD